MAEGVADIAGVLPASFVCFGNQIKIPFQLKRNSSFRKIIDQSSRVPGNLHCGLHVRGHLFGLLKQILNIVLVDEQIGLAGTGEAYEGCVEKLNEP